MRFSGFIAGATALVLASLLSAGNPAHAASPAAGLVPLKPLALAQSMIEKTHGWHRRCRRGLTDWHKHIRGVGRRTCTTRRCSVNSWGVRRCRWY